MSSRAEERSTLDVALAAALRETHDEIRDGLESRRQLVALHAVISAADRPEIERILANVDARIEERVAKLAVVERIARSVASHLSAQENAAAVAILYLMPPTGLPC